MNSSLLDRQSELPRSLPLFRYAPERARFSWQGWNPALVRSPSELPPYLILGKLDASSFDSSPKGWSARWQGTESDTHFDVTFNADEGRWLVRQTWRGLDGGYANYAVRIPLDVVVGQALNRHFPDDWDHAAKEQLESEYQLTVIEPPQNARTFFGIPDGALRTIAFPVAVRNLRPLRQWLQDVVAQSALPYPVSAEAKLIFQVINSVEGKAPEWTRQDTVAFKQSVLETGLPPQGFPVREVAGDGSAAWTLRRHVYFVFIGLPFAGLTDFLGRTCSETGPIRSTSGPDLRFELRPVILPAGFELQATSISLWDAARTTRSFLQFAPLAGEKLIPTVEQIIDSEKNAAATLATIETISSEVLAAVEQIFEQALTGSGA